MGTPTGTLGTFGNFGRKNQIFSLQGRNQYLTWCRCLCLSLYFCEISGEMFNKAPGWHHVTLWSFDKKVYKYSICIYIYVCVLYIYLHIQICDHKRAQIWGSITSTSSISLFVVFENHEIPPSCSFLGHPTPKNLQVTGSHVVQTV